MNILEVIKTKFLWFFREWLNTFSSKQSFFSSKRIERFIIFGVMMGLTIFYVISHITKPNCNLSSTDFMIIIGGWLGYAGFNTFQIKKDVKDINTSNDDPTMN